MAGSTATDAALPADLVARFAAALKRLRLTERRVGLAVSGGPDSMAMLLLAHAAVPGEIEVATVDHGLRPEAAEECALVEKACAARGIACKVLRVEVGAGNVQHQAREARYAALAGWRLERGLSAVATAHHVDDQAETLMMRLNRGSGVAGLSGVRESTFISELELRLIRPLLEFRRAELAQAIAATGAEVAHDRSNEDEHFDRVRIRRALAETDWLDPVALARSAALLAEADATLEWYAWGHFNNHHRLEGSAIVLHPSYKEEIDLRVIGIAIRELGGVPRGSEVARLRDRLYEGEGGNLAGVLVTVARDEWICRPEPPRGAR